MYIYLNKNKIFFFILYTFLYIKFYFYNLKILNKNQLKKDYLYILNKIFNKLNKTNLYDNMLESAQKARNYINISVNGILLKNKKLKGSKKPKISIVIPVYNKEKIIKRTLRSIQNQNMNDIEIILVNDYSTDNTLYTIQKLQKEDPRIIIINNQKNKGTLYSRCIGTLSSKGYYILPLDNDDMYLNTDIFDVLYNEGKTNNLDIIKFNGIQVRGINNFFKYKLKKINFAEYYNDNIIYQPELSYFFLKRIDDNGFYISTDLYMWLKCIKSKIYKKAISLYGKEKYSIFMTSGEDNIMTFIIFQIAGTFKYISKYCILRVSLPNSANKLIKKKDKIISKIYYLDTICEFSKNSFKNKEIILSITINLMNHSLFKKIIDDYKYKNLFNKYYLKF